MADLDGGPALLMAGEKITASHRARDAYVYVRQSTLLQVQDHTESAWPGSTSWRQRAAALGWAARRGSLVIDEDLGRSGGDGGRAGPGSRGWSPRWRWARSGIVLGLEMSRLARVDADWHQLLGAPRGAVYSCGDGRAPPPGRRSGLVKLEAA